MKRGRKTIPSEKKRLAGNPGKRPLPAETRKAKLDAGAPSEWLDAEAKAEWRRVIDELRRLGTFTVLDRAALEGYCRTYSLWVKTHKQIAELPGLVVKSPSGHPMEVPHLTIARKLGEDMRRWAVEFGMTPSSRASLFGSEYEPPKPSANDPAALTAVENVQVSDERRAASVIFHEA